MRLIKIRLFRNMSRYFLTYCVYTKICLEFLVRKAYKGIRPGVRLEQFASKTREAVNDHA
jgi:hypothetical protein